MQETENVGEEAPEPILQAFKRVDERQGSTGLQAFLAETDFTAWISWLTSRGQQSDSYTYLSSVTRYLPQLVSLPSFARILKACHLLWLEDHPPM